MPSRGDTHATLLDSVGAIRGRRFPAGSAIPGARNDGQAGFRASAALDDLETAVGRSLRAGAGSKRGGDV
jgi:hypothetical protein